MSIRIDRVVTRGGDAGQTSLGDGSRVSKATARIEAIGSLDELNAVVGVVRAHSKEGSAVYTELMHVQNLLFDMGADLCQPDSTTGKKVPRRVSEDAVLQLEQQISELQSGQAPLTSFVLPGGSLAAAWAHMARTQARKTERCCVVLAEQDTINPVLLKILNRLSDYFFVLSRHFNNDGQTDVLWVPG
ncbi:cob(I)yrinic acid a,c-diamide adenosyltransferase [Acetobacter cibinongensis]|uniref:Corrinoid adenosyltransferase n=1 Tax=Acetobacter cibinongensis TaxID=146475 RepID=A0A1Z5YY04_9PROT|nr:cob(I)yrinic acid a,c-diamide adenosyltransferase [Acetobacter cibinongensis]OUJ04147.1 cob(I)yrinic acid a c-diamide adenosyltransferase [Acetobacter cibinongensis]